MRTHDIKNFWPATLVLLWGLDTGPVAASVDVPLNWKSILIQTDDRGGAELKAAIGAGGDLDRLELTIRGRPISVPARCLHGLVRPYLNGINIAYGQFESGQSYWALELPFDGTGSVELESTFNLVFSETRLVWSYKTIQIDDKTWENRDVCPYSPSGLSETD